MPRLTTPPGMPEEVARVVELISNAVRTEVLHHLAERPMTAVELAERIGVVHSSVHRHLVLLEKHDLVVADHERHRRRGRAVVRWSTVPARVREVAEQWAVYAAGGSVVVGVDAPEE